MTVKDILSRPNPSASNGCDREDCLLCMGEKGRGGNCQKEGVVYRISCRDCALANTSAEYTGESSRTGYLRGREHLEGLEKESDKNALWKHCELHHEGVKTQFDMKILRSHRTPLTRQIHEGVEIDNSKARILMNSKGEWNGSRIPRIVIEVGEEIQEEEDDSWTRSGKQGKTNTKVNKEKWKMNSMKKRKGEEECRQTSKRRRVGQSEEERNEIIQVPGSGKCVEKPECGLTGLAETSNGVVTQPQLGLVFDKKDERCEKVQLSPCRCDRNSECSRAECRINYDVISQPRLGQSLTKPKFDKIKLSIGKHYNKDECGKTQVANECGRAQTSKSDQKPKNEPKIIPNMKNGNILSWIKPTSKLERIENARSDEIESGAMQENLSRRYVRKEKLTPKTLNLSATKKTIFKRKEKCNSARKTPLRGKSNGNVTKITKFFETLRDQSWVGVGKTVKAGVENSTNTATTDAGVGRAKLWVKKGVGGGTIVTTGPINSVRRALKDYDGRPRRKNEIEET